jgi:hypothetical protein
MEGIPANRQEMLDKYLDPKSNASIPPLLRLSLEAHAGKEGYNAVKLLEDAKKNGVPVYAFDSDAALLVNYWGVMKQGAAYTLPVEHPEDYTRKNPLDYRLLLMNEAASERIHQIEKTHPGKILVNVGGSHALPEDGIPGIGDYVGGGQVAIYNIDPSKSEKTGSKLIEAGIVKKGEGDKYPFEITRGAYIRGAADPDELKHNLEAGTTKSPQSSVATPNQSLPELPDVKKTLPHRHPQCWAIPRMETVVIYCN